jgi:hypothetical protein
LHSLLFFNQADFFRGQIIQSIHGSINRGVGFGEARVEIVVQFIRGGEVASRSRLESALNFLTRLSISS